MTKLLQIAFIGALAAMGILDNAQAADVTANVFLSVTISLTGVKQTNDAGIAKVRISNQDVIEAVGIDTANQFSSKAKLLLKIPVGLESGPGFVIRDIVNRTNVVDFEVPSTILWLIQIGDSVDNSRTSISGVTTASQVTIWEFAFQSSRGSFDVQGYTSATLDNRGNLNQKLADVCPTTVSSKVTGTGLDANGNSIVLQGTITANGRKIVNAN